MAHQKSSQRPAAAVPRSYLPVPVTEGVLSARVVSAAFSSGSASHRTKIMPWVRDPETFFLPASICLLSQCAGQSSRPRNTICGGFASCFAHRPIASLTGTCLPCPELVLRQLVDFLRLLAVAVLRPTPTANCYAQPLTAFRLSHRRSSLWGPGSCAFHRTTGYQYQASHFTISPGVAVDHALS